YNMGDYFAHWLSMRTKLSHPPKLFLVNWFRKDEDGKFLWPGFGDNMRVLKWVIDRAFGKIGGRETTVGWVPREGDIDLSGCEIGAGDFEKSTAIDAAEWLAELESQKEFYDKIGDSMPPALVKQRELLLETLRAETA